MKRQIAAIVLLISFLLGITFLGLFWFQTVNASVISDNSVKPILIATSSVVFTPSGVSSTPNTPTPSPIYVTPGSPTPTPELPTSGSPTPTPVLVTPSPQTPSKATSTPTLTNYNMVDDEGSTRPQSGVFAFIDAPSGPVPNPYVILTAYDTFPGIVPVEIKGQLNNAKFYCAGRNCFVPINQDSLIIFHAEANIGVRSEQVQAVVRLDRQEDGYYLSIELFRPAIIYTDSCAVIWDESYSPRPSWAQFYQSPNQFSTHKKLHYLASKLITNGVVDASSCPGGGMLGDAPNACGLEQVAEAMTLWQNLYDLNLWLSSQDIGIPPKFLKTLFELETQFWPESARFYLYEFGLAQINELGIDVLFRWNIDFYQAICQLVLSNCQKSYLRQSAANQALLRGVVLASMNADCPTCPYNLNMNKARDSVQQIALTVQANCADTNFLVLEYSSPPSYIDYWKYTMVAYHSGIGCLEQAVIETTARQQPNDWENLSQNLDCPGAKEYVDTLWGLLETFDDNLLALEDKIREPIYPTFIPLHTPVPSPTPFVSKVRLTVRVFIDANENGVMDEGEGLNGIAVTVSLPNNVQIDNHTKHGLALFDLTGYPVGSTVLVSLPDYYRSQSFTLPEEGDISIDFIFHEPEIPSGLP